MRLVRKIIYRACINVAQNNQFNHSQLDHYRADLKNVLATIENFPEIMQTPALIDVIQYEEERQAVNEIDLRIDQFHL
jgi:hypothetical protein